MVLTEDIRRSLHVSTQSEQAAPECVVMEGYFICVCVIESPLRLDNEHMKPHLPLRRGLPLAELIELRLAAMRPSA